MVNAPPAAGWPPPRSSMICTAMPGRPASWARWRSWARITPGRRLGAAARPRPAPPAAWADPGRRAAAGGRAAARPRLDLPGGHARMAKQDDRAGVIGMTHAPGANRAVLAAAVLCQRIGGSGRLLTWGVSG